MMCDIFFGIRHGIKVHGFSSDGDWRLLGAMRNQMACVNDICYMQDATHGVLKLRTCFLRSYAALPMGNKLVSVVHLKLLIRVAPKSVHGLVLSDLCPVDRQNFKSIEKCMSARTRNAAQSYVPGSEATQFFLKLCFEVTYSLMDHEITPYERIEMIFHAIFFLRIWRKWIKQSNYVLKDNFITSNAYLCAELNGTNLIKLIQIFRDENKAELFLPTLFDSQACERTFRGFRSMGTPNFTKINFTLLELLHMIRRLEVQNEILHSKLSHVDIKLPKLGKKRKLTTLYALPTDEEIKECLNRAKRFALNDASQFCMHIKPEEIDTCEVSIPIRLEADLGAERDDETNDDFEEENVIEHRDLDDINEALENNGILEGEDQHSALITMTDHLGKKQIVRKSTLVWLLSEGAKKISSDRLIRVRGNENKAINPGVSNDSSISNNVKVSKHIKLGDWCFFMVVTEAGEMVYIGLLHAFRFANCRLVKNKTYRYDAVDLVDKPNLAKQLEVLSTWYLVNDRAALVPVKDENHFFVSMENYIATVFVSPTMDPDTKALFFNENAFKEIEDAILKIIRK